MKKIVKEKQPFERLEMRKEDLLDMFSYNKFKVRILEEKVNTPTTTVYRCGPLIDLCRGPHVRHTGDLKRFEFVQLFLLQAGNRVRSCLEFLKSASNEVILC